MVNLMQLMPEERIVAMLPIRTIDEDDHIIFVTKKGIIKKTALSDYGNILKKGIIAINLREDDDIVDVKLSNGKNDIILVTKKGMCTRFNEEELRVLGRSATGVTAMRLADNDEIVSINLDSDGSYLLIVSEKGYGKLTDLKEFDTHHRGGKGLRCYKIAEKTGDVMGVMATELNEEILMITNDGVMIRIRVKDISIIGRNTSGVKLINIKNSDKYVSGISKIDPEEEETEASDAERPENAEETDLKTEGSEENA